LIVNSLTKSGRRVIVLDVLMMTLFLFLLFTGAAFLIYYFTRIRMKRKLEELRRKREEMPSVALELRNTKRWFIPETPGMAYKKIQLVLKNMDATGILPQPELMKVSATLLNNLGAEEKAEFILQKFEGKNQIVGRVQPRLGPDGNPVDRGLEVLVRFWEEYTNVYFDEVIAHRRDLIPLGEEKAVDTLGTESGDADKEAPFEESETGTAENTDKSLENTDKSLRALNAKKFSSLKGIKDIKGIESEELTEEKAGREDVQRAEDTGTSDEVDKAAPRGRTAVSGRTAVIEYRIKSRGNQKGMDAGIINNEVIHKDITTGEEGISTLNETEPAQLEDEKESRTETTASPAVPPVKIKDIGGNVPQKKFDFLGDAKKTDEAQQNKTPKKIKKPTKKGP